MKKLLIYIVLIFVSFSLFCCKNEEKGKLIEPLYMAQDMENIADGIYRVTFTDADIVDEADGAYISFKVFSRDLYDTVEIHQMKVGDRILSSGKETKIEEIHWDDQESVCCINFPSLEEAEEEFRPSDSGGTYYISGPDGHNTYTFRGEAKVKINENCAMVDSSEWGEPEKTIKKNELKEYIKNHDPDYYWYLNTELRVENKEIVELTHFYIP